MVYINIYLIFVVHLLVNTWVKLKHIQADYFI